MAHSIYEIYTKQNSKSMGEDEFFFSNLIFNFQYTYSLSGVADVQCESLE